MGRWLILAMFALASSVAAETWHVDDDADGASARDGSVARPFEAIQDAIDASSDGDVVLIADGTYTGAGNRDLDFGGRAIIVRSENGPAVTVIDCGGSPESSHRGFIFRNDEGPSAVVRGLTITGGYVGAGVLSGAGVYCPDGSPTIIDCVITGNTIRGLDEAFAIGQGGGVHGSVASAPSLIGCVISKNVIDVVAFDKIQGTTGVALGGGASLWSGTLSDCLFERNTAQGGSYASGGGLSGVNVAVTGCAFVSNAIVSGGPYPSKAEARGGGAAIGTATALSDCIFVGNSAASSLVMGGGLTLVVGSVRRCSFTDNHAEGLVDERAVAARFGESVDVRDTRCSMHAGEAVEGGSHFLNCQFVGNQAALRIDAGHAAVVNCTFADNGTALVGSLVVSVMNSIFWKNSSAAIVNVPMVHHCLVPGGYPGVGNIDADPLLDSIDGILHPAAGSPVIDAGDSGAVEPDASHDLAGGPRFVDDPDTADTGLGPPPVVDIGAVEFQLPCPDTNDDGIIDVDDLNAVITGWGTTDAAADVNGDGIVDAGDLGSVLAGWGVCP